MVEKVYHVTRTSNIGSSDHWTVIWCRMKIWCPSELSTDMLGGYLVLCDSMYFFASDQSDKKIPTPSINYLKNPYIAHSSEY